MLWPNPLLVKAVKVSRYGSLIDINPSGDDQPVMEKKEEEGLLFLINMNQSLCA